MWVPTIKRTFSLRYIYDGRYWNGYSNDLSNGASPCDHRPGLRLVGRLRPEQPVFTRMNKHLLNSCPLLNKSRKFSFRPAKSTDVLHVSAYDAKAWTQYQGAVLLIDYYQPLPPSLIWDILFRTLIWITVRVVWTYLNIVSVLRVISTKKASTATTHALLLHGVPWLESERVF